MNFDSVESTIEAVGRGELVIVVDDDDRENEGDLIMAAAKATPNGSHLWFVIRAAFFARQ